MAIVLSRDALIGALRSQSSILRAMQSQVRSIYRDAANRLKEAEAPSSIQRDCQSLLDQVEKMGDDIAAQLTALNFTFETRYAPSVGEEVEVLPDAWRDEDGVYQGCGVIQPVSKSSTWFDGVTEPFQPEDRVRVEKAENADNDGVYAVGDNADIAANVQNHVRDGDFSLDDATDRVTNGTFDGGIFPWTGTAWAWDGVGAAVHSPVATDPLKQSAILNIGTAYEVIYTVSDKTTGSITAYCGTAAGAMNSSNGTFYDTIVCYGNPDLSFIPTMDFDGKIDNVTVRAYSWHFGGGWTRAGGKAVRTPSAASLLSMGYTYMAVAPTADKLYHLRFTLSDVTAGTVTAKINSNPNTWLVCDADGTYDLVCKYEYGSAVQFHADAEFAGKVDDVQLYPLRGVALREPLSTKNLSDSKLNLVLVER